MLDERPGRQIFEHSHLCQNELAIQCRQPLDCVSVQRSWNKRWTEEGGWENVLKSPHPQTQNSMTNHDCKKKELYVQCHFLTLFG